MSANTKPERFTKDEKIAHFCAKQIFYYEKKRKKLSDIEVGMIDAYKSVLSKIESLR